LSVIATQTTVIRRVPVRHSRLQRHQPIALKPSSNAFVKP
jgi:hypothetical protein